MLTKRNIVAKESLKFDEKQDLKIKKGIATEKIKMITRKSLINPKPKRSASVHIDPDEDPETLLEKKKNERLTRSFSALESSTFTNRENSEDNPKTTSLSEAVRRATKIINADKLNQLEENSLKTRYEGSLPSDLNKEIITEEEDSIRIQRQQEKQQVNINRVLL